METVRHASLKHEKQLLEVQKEELLHRLSQAGLTCNFKSSTMTCMKCGRIIIIDPS